MGELRKWGLMVGNVRTLEDFKVCLVDHCILFMAGIKFYVIDF